MPSNREPLVRRTVRKYLIGYQTALGVFLIGRDAAVQSHTSGGLTVAFNIPDGIKGMQDEEARYDEITAFQDSKQNALRNALDMGEAEEVRGAEITESGVRAGVVWFRLTSPAMLAQQGRGAHGTATTAAAAVIEAAQPVAVPPNQDLDPIDGAVVAEAAAEAEEEVLAGLESEPSEE